MKWLRIIVLWFITVGFIISISGIGYQLWQVQQGKDHELRVHTLNTATKILQIQQKLEANSAVWHQVLAEIPLNQALIIRRIEELLQGEGSALGKKIQRYQQETRAIAKDQFEAIMDSQGQKQLDDIHKHQHELLEAIKMNTALLEKVEKQLADRSRR